MAGVVRGAVWAGAKNREAKSKAMPTTTAALDQLFGSTTV